MQSWLPWVAIAAGVVMVSSAVVIHERAASIRVAQEHAAVTVAKETPPPPPLLQPAMRQQAERSPVPAVKQDQRRQAAVSPAQVNTVKKVAPAVAEPAAAMEQETYSNLPLPVTGQPGQQMTTAAAAAATSTMEAANLPASPQVAAQDESVHGTMSAEAKSAPAPTARAAAAPAFGGLIGGTGVLARSTTRAQWRISAKGEVERSMGYGPWRTIQIEEKARMRVVSVSGDEVWLGGESLRLYHSEDNGATWHMVQLPAKGSGEHVVSHIHFESAQTGTVEADDGTQWGTIDGGKTWK